MDVEQFIQTLSIDHPFSYPEPNRRTDLLLKTRTIDLILHELERLRMLSVNDSFITAVVGRAGSGKTHLLLHLEHLSKEKKYPGLVIVLRLSDYHNKDITVDFLIKYIVNSQLFVDRAKQLDIKVTPPVRKRFLFFSRKAVEVDFTKVLNDFLEKSCTVESAGILFAIDEIDERLRPLGKDKTKIKDFFERFLGQLRTLLVTVPRGLLVVLSLTDPDAFNGFMDAMGDPSLYRRVALMYDEKREEVLKISTISREEARLLVSLYMEQWARKNNIRLPDVEGCKIDGLNLFPFMVSAVDLIWETAEGWAGNVCFFCSECLSRLIDRKGVSRFEELVITNEDAALCIFRSGKCPPLYKDKVLNTISEGYVEQETQKWRNAFASSYENDIWKAGFESAFLDFLEGICEEKEKKIEIKPEEVSDPQEEHRIYRFQVVNWGEEKRIGILFWKSAGESRDLGKMLGNALYKEKITHAFIIMEEKIADLLQTPQGWDSERVFQEEFEKIVRPDYDYTDVIRRKTVPPLIAWGIIMRHLEIQDRDLKKKWTRWLESKLNMFGELNNLVSKSPRRKSSQQDWRTELAHHYE